MDLKSVKEITRKATKWATEKGFETDAEDMTQHVLLRLSQNRQAKVSQICIDYVRAAYGRTGATPHKNQRNKSSEKKFYYELSDEVRGLEVAYELNIEQMDFSVIQRQFDEKDRAIITLRFKWGLTEAEIGDCFGLCESRVCQLLAEIEDKLRDLFPKKNTR